MQTAHHDKGRVFIQKDLQNCTHVFLRNDAVRPPLQLPYDGPYKVIKRGVKVYTIDVKGRPTKVAIDRLKAAFVWVTPDEEIPLETPSNSAQQPPPTTKTTKSGRQVRLPTKYQ